MPKGVWLMVDYSQNGLFLIAITRSSPSQIQWTVKVPNIPLENAKELLDKARLLAIEQDQLLLKQYPPKVELPVNPQLKQTHSSSSGWQKPSSDWHKPSRW